ncbi:MAG: hypothetical protein WB699_15580, partial [Bacteroidota bacterium]
MATGTTSSRSAIPNGLSRQELIDSYAAIRKFLHNHRILTKEQQLMGAFLRVVPGCTTALISRVCRISV